MKTLDWSVETLGLDYNSTGLCIIIYLNQSSERNMINIPGCSERTNFIKLTFQHCDWMKVLMHALAASCEELRARTGNPP